MLNATATPRANVQVERYNRKILDALAASTDNEDEWNKHISKIKWGLNSSINTVTGKSPYELQFGFVPRGNNDAFLSAEAAEFQYDIDIQKTRSEVKKKLDVAQAKQKVTFDARRKIVSYVVGDQVLVQRMRISHDGTSRKLVPKYDGPYVITKLLKNDRYLIESYHVPHVLINPIQGYALVKTEEVWH